MSKKILAQLEKIFPLVKNLVAPALIFGCCLLAFYLNGSFADATNMTLHSLFYLLGFASFMVLLYFNQSKPAFFIICASLSYVLINFLKYKYQGEYTSSNCLSKPVPAGSSEFCLFLFLAAAKTHFTHQRLPVVGHSGAIYPGRTTEQIRLQPQPFQHADGIAERIGSVYVHCRNRRRLHPQHRQRKHSRLLSVCFFAVLCFRILLRGNRIRINRLFHRRNFNRRSRHCTKHLCRDLQRRPNRTCQPQFVYHPL